MQPRQDGFGPQSCERRSGSYYTWVDRGGVGMLEVIFTRWAVCNEDEINAILPPVTIGQTDAMRHADCFRTSVGKARRKQGEEAEEAREQQEHNKIETRSLCWGERCFLSQCSSTIVRVQPVMTARSRAGACDLYTSLLIGFKLAMTS